MNLETAISVPMWCRCIVIWWNVWKILLCAVLIVSLRAASSGESPSEVLMYELNVCAMVSTRMCMQWIWLWTMNIITRFHVSGVVLWIWWGDQCMWELSITVALCGIVDQHVYHWQYRGSFSEGWREFILLYLLCKIPFDLVVTYVGYWERRYEQGSDYWI